MYHKRTEGEVVMPCEICGRSSCTRCFHSINEQIEFDNKTGKYAPDDPTCIACPSCSGDGSTSEHNKGFTLIELMFVIGGVAAVGIGVCLVYIVIHFVSKLW
jgi:hypothetical protein